MPCGDSENELMVTRVEGCWEGIVKDLGMVMYALLLFKVDNQQAPTV